MKKKIEISAFILICIMVISLAVKAGRHHDQCRECNFAVKSVK